MFNLNYIKNNNVELFNDFNKFGVTNIRNYIPIYTRFFNLHERNYNTINLNQPYTLVSVHPSHSLEKTDEPDTYEGVVTNGGEPIKKKIFLKFSPLLDPVKYMIGFYNNMDIGRLPTLNEDVPYSQKMSDINNSAYIDGFFTYLTSNVLHTHGFIHGVDFHGSFLGNHAQFKISILEDIGYMNDSVYFHKHKDKLFKIHLIDHDFLLNSKTRTIRPKLTILPNIDIDNDNGDINDTDTDICVYDIPNIDEYDDVFESHDTSNSASSNKTTQLIYNTKCVDNSIPTNCKVSESRQSDCSSNTSETTSESDTGSSYSDSASYSDNDVDLDFLEKNNYAILYNYPIQIICLEALDGTLDSLLKCSLTTSEWASCLFQIIITLISYQKMFKLTHNDLHTSNIMYIHTSNPYIYYKHNNIHYKIPTYGKIFKIIDFGRAIYEYNGLRLCSDSFHKQGDAYSQYNCMPYMNKHKKIYEPNFSFDLCRLGCSLYDYFKDGLGDKFNTNPISKLIQTWCLDDTRTNILYKTTGEIRYPEFKLYKMIVRKVHNHNPLEYITHPIFKSFITNRKVCKKKRIINVDKLPIYWNKLKTPDHSHIHPLD
jgi:hypothetical protein